MVGGLLDGSIIVVYLVGMLAVGYWGYRKSATLEDYLVAGRNIPFWMYVPVMSAVILGGASTIGAGGLGYQYGMSGAWLVIWLGLGIAAVGLLISTNLSNLRAYTLGQVLERRFDKYSGTVGAVIAGVYALTIAITQTISIGVVFDALFGVPPNVAITVAGLIVIAYTALGGMWSVTVTDFLQWWIMTFGVLLALILALGEVGGLGTLYTALDPSFFSPTAIGYDTIIGYFLLYFLGIMIGQDIWQRVFTADGPKTARWGNVAAGGYAIVYGLATTLLGVCALALFPGITDRDLALPTLVLEAAPVGVSGLILAGFISAMMSTASSGLLASSTLFTSDIYQRFLDPGAPERRYTLVSRLGIVLLGFAMIAAAVAIGDVINALTLAYNLLTGAIFVPIMGAFFWRRATWQGALSSIVVASLVVVGTMMLHGFDSNLPIVYGLSTSFLAFTGVSFLTGPPASGQLDAWHESTHTRPPKQAAAHGDPMA